MKMLKLSSGRTLFLKFIPSLILLPLCVYSYWGFFTDGGADNDWGPYGLVALSLSALFYSRLKVITTDGEFIFVRHYFRKKKISCRTIAKISHRGILRRKVARIDFNELTPVGRRIYFIRPWMDWEVVKFMNKYAGPDHLTR